MNALRDLLNSEYQAEFYRHGKDSTPYCGDFNNQIQLTHGTYSNALPLIIQMGALAGPDFYSEKAHYQKLFGGESGDSKSYTSSKVSFWNYYDREMITAGFYGYNKGFEYPIEFSINRDNADILNKMPGSMGAELTVDAYVPLEKISHVFVPDFKVKEVSEIFKLNGYLDVQVMRF